MIFVGARTSCPHYRVSDERVSARLKLNLTETLVRALRSLRTRCPRSDSFALIFSRFSTKLKETVTTDFA
ncbi:MAG: hypothetical protein M3Q99_07845 [Acidobacteriota bacterium]|nr:hypothetical protein [Acidobacteriota bacterium]